MGHFDTVLVLLDSDPMMVNKTVDNKTPLHAAYYGGQLKIIKLLLDKGAEVDNTLLNNPYRRNNGDLRNALLSLSHSSISGSSSSLDTIERSPDWRDRLNNSSSFDSRIQGWGLSSNLDTIRPPTSINHENPQLLPYPSSTTIQSNGDIYNMSFMTSPSETSLFEAIASHLHRRSFSSLMSRFDPLSRPLDDDDQH
jgi:ankyrin repeat protein